MLLLLKLEQLKERQAKLEQKLKEQEARELEVAGRVLVSLLKEQPQSQASVNAAASKLNLNKRDQSLFDSFFKKHAPTPALSGSTETAKPVINGLSHENKEKRF